MECDPLKYNVQIVISTDGQWELALNGLILVVLLLCDAEGLM